MGLIEETIKEYHTRRYPGIVHYAEIPLRFKIIREMIGTAKPKKVCDLCCSDGAFGELLIKDGHKVYGIDISSPALKIAKDRGVTVLTKNIEEDKFPFPNNYFDVVTILESIALIYDTDSLINKIAKILKKGGNLIISTPNTLSLGRRISYLFGKGVFLEGGLKGKGGGSVRYFTKDLLFELLKRNGFEPVHFESTYINFDKSGLSKSRLLARAFPNIGSSIIVKAVKL